MAAQRRIVPLMAVMIVSTLWLAVMPGRGGEAWLADAGGETNTAGDPLRRGPYAVAVDSFEVKNKATGNRISVDCYLPGAEGERFPLVLLLHGFMHNKEGHRDHARHLASWGFAVVVPDLTYGLVKQNLDERVRDMIYLYERIVAEQSRPGEPLARADTARLGLVGHSAGGLTALALAGRRAVQAVVGLDAVLSAGPPGTRKLAIDPVTATTIESPVLLVEAPPQSCNNQRDHGATVYPALLSLQKLRVEIKGASHCDFIDPSRACAVFCRAGGDDARRAIARRYTVAWLRYHLAGDTAMALYLDGEEAARLVAEGRVAVLGTSAEQPSGPGGRIVP